MDRVMVDHFQGLLVILDCNVSATVVSMEFLEAKTD